MMRSATYTLALYIGLLTIQPSIGLAFANDVEANCAESCSQSCCESDCQPNEEQPQNTKTNSDCCPNGICNPLVNCYCCMGVTMRQSIAEFIPVAVLNAVEKVENKNGLTSYIADRFNPPENVVW